MLLEAERLVPLLRDCARARAYRFDLDPENLISWKAADLIEQLVEEIRRG